MAVAAGLAFYLDAATLMTVAIALPIWRDVYELGPWQVGMLSAGLAFAVAAGALVGGWLGDRFGRGLVFTYDLVVFVLGTVVIVLAPSGTVLAVGVIVVGLTAGADVPTALAMISDHAPDHARGRLTAITQVMWIGAVLATFVLGFAVSTLGFVGIRILVAQLVVLAVLALGLRLVLMLPRAGREPVLSPPRSRIAVSPRRLVARGVGAPLLLTGLFFLFWNAASTTLGSYGVYFVVTVTRLTQTQATGLVLLTFPIALAMSVIFVRLADTRWRDRLFVVAMGLQIAAFAVGALTGGTMVIGMLALMILYSLSNVFGGEAVYKVWSQLLLPADLRATAIGLTFATARAAAAVFMLGVPALVELSPTLLLWLLVGCVTVSGSIGLVIIRRRAFSSLLQPVEPAS
jgi:MFS transporter, SP family, inositol transporter